MVDLDLSSMFGVKGLVVVITGGGTGIGLMMAQGLEANGAIVYILGRRMEVLEKAAATAKHGNIHPFKADVTSKSDLQAAVDFVAQKSGYVNLVVANSGVSGPTLVGLKKDPSLGELRDYLFNTWEKDDFNQTFDVNVTAVFYTHVAFLELLDKGNKAGNVQQKSQIVTVSSIGGFNRIPLAGFAYSASKSGATHMMKQFSSYMSKYDIRSNVIAPGLYPSEMTMGKLFKPGEEAQPVDRSFVPEGRKGDTVDMAGAILFIASRAGGYLNGNVLCTDGGRLGIIPSTY